MAQTKDEKLADLEAELIMVTESITRIYQNGQNFKKGASAGFSVEFANITTLQARKETLLNKIHTWEAS